MVGLFGAAEQLEDVCGKSYDLKLVVRALHLSINLLEHFVPCSRVGVLDIRALWKFRHPRFLPCWASPSITAALLRRGLTAIIAARGSIRPRCRSGRGER